MARVYLTQSQSLLKKVNFSKILALIVYVICACVVLGWTTQNSTLRSFIPNLPQMIPMTALTVLILNTSLFLLTRFEYVHQMQTQPRVIGASRLLSLLVIFLAAETLLEHIIGFDVGLHRFITPDFFHLERTLYSGRMSPQTSISALFLGLSLLVFSFGLKKILRFIYQLGVCLAISISVLALVGYLYRITPFYGLSRFLGLSIPTAVSFLLLSFAALGLDRKEGFVGTLLQKNSGGFFFRRFAVVSVALPLATALIIRWGELWGLYPSSFSTAVFVVITIFSLFFLAYKTAESIARSERQALRLERSQVASAEAELRHDAVEEIRSRMIHALQASQMGYWEWDFASNQVNWSEWQNTLFGFTPGVTVRHMSEILRSIHPLDVALVQHKINYAIKSHTELDVEFRIVVRSLLQGEEIRWITCRGRAQYDRNGRGFCMHGTNFDVTEKKIASDRTAEQARLLEVTHDAVIVRDAENRITFWNRGAEQLYGYVASEALGADSIRLLGTKFPQGPEPIQQELVRKAYWEGELEHRTKSGRVITVMSRWTLTDRAGSGAVSSGHFRTLETNTDITGLKETERQLVKAKEEAEAANELKSSFLANMSHEIRTPLGAILGFVELISDPAEIESNKQQYFKIIRRNGEQLSNLINDILDLSKVESGQFKVEIGPCSVKNVVQEVLASLSVSANDKNLQIHLRIDESISDLIHSDASRLKQILMNIVGNAVKFTYNGSIQVEVRKTEKPGGAGNMIVFAVSDTGIGITPEQAKLLFQPFSQGDPGITRKFGGTGLGLVLSRELARALGGELRLTSSRWGEGSTFEISIQDYPAPLDSGFVSVAKPSAQGLALGDDVLKNLRILLVEDSPDNQDLISYMLHKKGATVDIAENGLVGVQKAFAGNYDIILMDIQMPVMDGYTAIQKLRLEGFKKPIIALTAHAMVEVRRKCLDVGFNDYLTKPIRADELVKIVANATAVP